MGYLEVNYASAPSNPWIKASKTKVAVGEEVTFTYDATGATQFLLGIDKNGTRVSTPDPGSNRSYTTKFNTAGTYTIYAGCINSHGYDDSPKITFYVRNTPTTATIATRSGSRIEIQTSISNLSRSASCVAAVYDSSGKLIGQTANDVDGSTNSVTAYFPNYSNASYVKVFLWDSLEGMKPLTNGEKVTL